MSRALFTAVQSIDDFLTLNALDRITLNKFTASTESTEDPLERMQLLIRENGHIMADDRHLPFIIKASHHNDIFAAFCATEPFKERWGVVSATQMILLCSKLALPTFDLELKNSISAFNHMCGLYLCVKSLKVAELFPDTEFPPLVAKYLEYAFTTHRSIHALQRYNAYRYQEIDKELAKPEPDFEIIESSYLEIIASCQSMIKDYGSYACMMLAEANTRAALFYSKKPDKTAKECRQAHHFFSLAMRSCEKANAKMAESESAIAFASLNQGLGASNSFGFTEPLEAKITITRLMTGCVTEAEAKAGDHATRPATMPGV
ncbi:MAG: DUF5630 domain-containing protein [Coxiellaceae bacterium]|nr:DUF5630 domain-containing protein [Coxiellaceae bacterium]